MPGNDDNGHMFIPYLIPVVVSLTAVLARRAPVIAVRRPQDGSPAPSPDPNAIPAGPRVLLISPTSLSNSSLTYNTCDPVYLWWFYDTLYRSELQADAFNLTITNVGVDQDPPPPATSTSSDAGSTTSSPLSPSISSTSNPGTFPPTFLPRPEPTISGVPPPATLPTQDPTTPIPGTRRRLGRRSDITRLLAHDLLIVQDNHYYFWPHIDVPSGYYVLKGVSTKGSSIEYSDSSAFYIGAGSTACFTSPTGAPPSGGDNDTGGSQSPVVIPSNRTGVIAGAVVGVVLGLLALSGLAFLFLVRRRRRSGGASGGAWGHVSSNDSRRTRAIGLPVGPVRRLPHPADLPAEYERESFDDEKDGGLNNGVRRSGSGSTGRSAASALQPPRPTSEAYALSMLASQSHSQSHSQSRRSTLQSIPTTVTPTDAPPSPVSPAALARANSASGAPRKAARKPVPVYDAADESRETLPSSETDFGLAPPGAELSSSLRSDTGLLSGIPFELDGAKGQVHYLIPDPPLPPSRR